MTKLTPDIIDAYAKGLKDLVKFRNIFLPALNDVESASFHDKISDILLNGKENFAIEAFRQSGKTTLIRAFCLYCLTYPSSNRSYIPIIKSNKTSAGNFIKQIADIYNQNPVFQLNKVKVMEDSGDCFMVRCKGEKGELIDVRFESYGKLSPVRGLNYKDKRPDVVIMDDIQDKKEMQGETVPESDWDWFLSDVSFLGKDCRIFMIGNNLGDKCIIERLMELEGKLEKVNFSCQRIPIEQDGVIAWPEMFDHAYIEAEKKDYELLGKIDIWYMERMCVAFSDDSRTFLEEDYRYAPPGIINNLHTTCKFSATLDPATSKNKESCFRAITVVATDVDDNWFLVDVPYGRWDSVELIDKIFETVIRWNLQEFGIEKGMLKDFLEPILQKEMARRMRYFNIVPLEHGKIGSKLDRILMLAPRFKSHKIYFIQDAEYLTELRSELRGVTRHSIKSLFIDLVDALAMQIQVAQKPWGVNENELHSRHRGNIVKPMRTAI